MDTTSPAPPGDDFFIQVTLHGDVCRLRPRDAPDRAPLQVRGATVADVLAQLGVRPDEPLIIAVNGEITPRSTVLCPGDELLISSPMEGG